MRNWSTGSVVLTNAISLAVGAALSGQLRQKCTAACTLPQDRRAREVGSDWGSVWDLRKSNYTALHAATVKEAGSKAELFGCADAAPIVTLMHTQFAGAADRPLVFLDLGCHVAEFSAHALELYGDASLRRLVHAHRLHNVSGEAGTCAPPWWTPGFSAAPQTALAPIVLAAELSPEVAKVAQTRAELERWDRMGFRLRHRAMAETPREAVRVQRMPHVPSKGIPEVNSLLLESAAASDAFTVRQTNVDQLLREEELDRVFWMHVDAEGMDAAVLRGASGTLSSGKVDFLDFEYHGLWRRRRRRDSERLHAAVQRLDGYGYRCALILPSSGGPSRRLVPATGDWWDPAYESYRWSSVFCAHRRHDGVMQAVLRWFNSPLAAG
eukprot:TRINITY_DN33538_c0_g1_i1.p2 TRINITY_DN33538_c0_g1~~TRINITY_DN33538_c0_g1_i1.p2  ORF type:complete len:382 (+),score=128.23 TRINITY_DN33538_c0_g1_i1:50-1195(+)